MQTDNKFLDDLARVASGALGSLQGVRDEIAARVRDQFDRFVADRDLVSREEFDAVKAMAARGVRLGHVTPHGIVDAPGFRMAYFNPDDCAGVLVEFKEFLPNYTRMRDH